MMVRLLLLVIMLSWGSAAWAVESICPGGSSPRSDIVFCEDWETYNPITNASFPDTEGSTFHGWTATDNDRSDGHGFIQSTLKHAGTYALRQQVESGGNFVADIERALTSTQDIRIRFYVYFASPYGNMGIDFESNQHIMFLNTTLSFTGPRFDIYAYINIPDDDADQFATCGCNLETGPCTGGRESDNFLLISNADDVKKGVLANNGSRCVKLWEHYNEWMLVEWSWKRISASEVRGGLWINGVEMMSNEHMGAPDSAGSNITKLIVSGYMSNAPSISADIYFDDIVVSNNSALTIGASGAAPAEPSRFNLNLNLRRASHALFDWFAAVFTVGSANAGTNHTGH